MRINRVSQSIDNKDIKKIDLSLLNPLIEKYRGKSGNIIPLLQGVQNFYGYLPQDAFIKLESELNLSLSDMYGVATFYAQFKLNPVGKYIIKVCHGTACHVQNATQITETLENILQIKDGETTKDNLFTLESVACLGCCSLAPVMTIGEETYGGLDKKSTLKIIKQWKANESEF